LSRLDGYSNEVATDVNFTGTGGQALFGPYMRSWLKDYFTSALPWQQRGGEVAFPITGTLPVNFPNDPAYVLNDYTNQRLSMSGYVSVNSSGPGPAGAIYPLGANTAQADFTLPTGSPTYARVNLGPASVDLGQGVSFDVDDLRTIVQVQKWMERNARGGIRYTELLRTHFGVSPSDARLQRPEYIGGTKSPLVVSEVLQTNNSQGNSPGNQASTPQANMSGHGIMASNGFIGKYFVKEFGLILGLMSIMPTPSYEDGIDRQWLRITNKDFFWPEFVNLSEQGILNMELYAVNDSGGQANQDQGIWGYQPQYDEMRIKRNMVCTEMRVNSLNNISFWHLGRAFSALPLLNSNFIRCDSVGSKLRRSMAVTSIMPFMVSHANRIKAVRPIPYIGEPGLVDHH
jgi:hypothetical protein